MKKILLIVALILCVSVNVFAEVYQNNNITITYESKVDLESALDSIEWVDKWFADFGYHGDPKINITFKNVVILEEVRVYGLCVRKTNHIEMTSWLAPWLKVRKAFTLPVTEELHHSVIVHELTHLYLSHFAKKRILNGAQEYFAYTIQLTWLSKETRDKILEIYKDNEFDCDGNINGMIHGCAPHAYGIMSYKWSQKHNGDYLRKIIKNEFDNDNLVMP